MQNLILSTSEEIQSVVRNELRSELRDFFSSFQLPIQPMGDEIGGIDLAVKITGKAKATIYSLCSLRKIPHGKQGNQLYFSRKELLEWISSGRRKTASEIQTAAGIN